MIVSFDSKFSSAGTILVRVEAVVGEYHPNTPDADCGFSTDDVNSRITKSESVAKSDSNHLSYTSCSTHSISSVEISPLGSFE